MNKPTKWTQTITLPHLCTGVITREAKQLENPKHVFLVKRSRALKLTNCTGVGEIVGIVENTMTMTLSLSAYKHKQSLKNTGPN